MTNLSVEQINQKLRAFKNFTGGPIEKFSDVALATFYTLSMYGLKPDSKFLDIGCGALRLGFLIMNYLDSSRYYGVEPNVAMLDEGKDTLAKVIIENKKPFFSNAEDFSFHDQFGCNDFDFALARSIFTHASRKQIEICFNELSKVMKPQGVFCLTFVQPTKLFDREYSGSEWVGRSHKSSKAGIVKYKKETLLNIGNNCGFYEDQNAERNCLTANQEWLIFRKS